jgi:hypothetical protein
MPQSLNNNSLHENFLNLIADLDPLYNAGLSEFTGPQGFLQAPKSTS